jgi:sulfate adenylyltransferase subunit 1 (EFTu-like GTPase family)
LLRIPHVVAAVNKMDIVDFDVEVFDRICGEFTALAAKLGLTSIEVIPISALLGDNVVEPSVNMPWYTGPTLLDYLETVPLRAAELHGPLRFPVQLVVRPNADFRGFAGRVERGEVRPGMRVKALPSGRITRVKSIVTYDGELVSASAPRSVTLEREDEIDLSRGEMLIAEAEAAPHVSNAFSAMVVWMHEQPLAVGQTYLAKHTTRTVRATVRAIRYRVDIVSAEHNNADQLRMNDIAEVEFDCSLPLFFDAYAESREMGALILIDPVNNATVGAAMIVSTLEPASANIGRNAAFFLLCGRPEAAATLHATLTQRGERAIIVDDDLIPNSALPAAIRALQLAGVTAISTRENLSAGTIEVLRRIAGEAFFESEEEAR